MLGNKYIIILKRITNFFFAIGRTDELMLEMFKVSPTSNFIQASLTICLRIEPFLLESHIAF